MRLLLLLSALLTGLTGAFAGVRPVEARQVEQAIGAVVAASAVAARPRGDHRGLTIAAPRAPLVLSVATAPDAPAMPVRSRIESALE